MHIRNDRFDKGNECDASIGTSDFKEIIASAKKVGDGADVRSLTLKPNAETDEVEQVKFTIVEGGTIVRWNEQVLSDQGFGTVPIVDAFKMDHEQRSSRQLSATHQLHFLGVTPFGSEPTGSWMGEAFWEIAAGIDFQIPFQPLRPHQAADREPFH